MGVWRGWYEQNGERHEMRIQKFKVKSHKISGEGSDVNGEFEIVGYYTSKNSIHFIKQYKGAHQVHYTGARLGQSMTGRW